MTNNDNVEQAVCDFIRDELCVNPKSKWYNYFTLDYSLSTGKFELENLTGIELLTEYADRFNVDMRSFNYDKYWPEPGIPFLPNFLLPDYLKTSHHEPEPLTIGMLVESAKAGRWLYD